MTLSLQATAQLESLEKRAQLVQQLRTFFYDRQVLEVDVPALAPYPAVDCHIDSMNVLVQLPGRATPETLYLQTSPEYALKRLVAQTHRDVFYLGKAYRNGDLSPRHQPEFTMLEWYRVGFNMADLIAETLSLLQTILQTTLGDISTKVLTYQQAFARYTGIENIHQAKAKLCYERLQALHPVEIVGVSADDKMLWEQLLLTEVIEPHLGRTESGVPSICCLTEFPAHAAALAKLSPERPEVALRFECYVNGMELANGYEELQNAEAYRQAFEQANTCRQQNGKPPLPIDDAFIKTLKETPLPLCSGIALGVDRLFMVQQNLADISEGVAFVLQKIR